MKTHLKRSLMVLTVILAVSLILTVLRAKFPGFFDMIEARLGHNSIIGLQAGLAAMAGVLVGQRWK